MELKEYQQKALEKLTLYLHKLLEYGKKKAAAAELGIRLDVFGEAWRDANGKGTYLTRTNGVGQEIPFVCFKIPTGGGKTLLAVRAIELLRSEYVQQPQTFVLWVVPSQTIYRQTLQALRDRDHPYRQTLDFFSGNRTLILEKTSRFTPAGLQNQLAIMLLMLPSANRRDKETLKIFQDSSGFEDFFPDEDDEAAHRALSQRVPNLSRYSDDALMTSLGNTLRLLRPIIIIDEGHKAYSQGARQTINDFNPRFVLELSATPAKESNILVSVGGQELNREQMVKLDLHIRNVAGPDWKDTLLAAKMMLDDLQAKATQYRAAGEPYIRPICLIQVERTGKDQQDKGFIHANDVAAELLNTMGVSPWEVKIKSSENDGLENIDLLAEGCPVRYIITKQALQEGWDCPFAYILVILTNPNSKTAITQLIGRILRQPYARKIDTQKYPDLEALNESYIYCYRRKANQLIQDVRRGFDEEGMSDLAHRAYEDESDPLKLKTVGYRPEFRRFENRIYLPVLIITANGQTRRLKYEADILSEVDWEQVAITAFDFLPTGLPFEGFTIRSTLSANGGVEITQNRLLAGLADASAVKFDMVFVSTQLLEIVPNGWMAYELVKRARSHLESQGYSNEQLANSEIQFIQEFRIFLTKERDRLAQLTFLEMVKQSQIRLVVDIQYSYLLPDSIRVSPPRLNRTDNSPLQLTLLEETPENEYNDYEKGVAVQLDKQAELILWWDRNFSRNIARANYYVEGWRENKIYPDFIIAKRDILLKDEYSQLLLLETKGKHLRNNDDTVYKERVFDLYNRLCKELAAEWNAEVGDNTTLKRLEFQLVYQDEGESGINQVLQGSGAS